MCICPGCPSYTACIEEKEKKELAFCFSGKSKFIKEMKGCHCSKCPVQKENDFKHEYYCTKGNEILQSKK